MLSACHVSLWLLQEFAEVFCLSHEISMSTRRSDDKSRLWTGCAAEVLSQCSLTPTELVRPTLRCLTSSTRPGAKPDARDNFLQ